MIVIGRRSGAVGLRQVVTLTRVGDRFEATAMGGARLITGVPHERVESVHGATVDGRSVELSWTGAADLQGRPLRRVGRILTSETADAVHVLLISEPTEIAATRGDGWHAGTGMTATAPLLLDRELAGRRLMSDDGVPAHEVAVG